jgi:hypothetical protein
MVSISSSSVVLPCYLTTNPACAQFFLLRHKLGKALKKEGAAYAARPQKTLFPHPASGAFAQGAFGAVHSGGAVAGVQLHDATAAFFCPGHHDFCARPATAGVAGKIFIS